MNLTRRDFLGGAMVAVAAAFSRRALAGDGAPNLIFGVLSDPHVTDDPATADVLEKVFAYLRSQNVDAVVISGDITHLGLVSGDLSKLKIECYDDSKSLKYTAYLDPANGKIRKNIKTE